MEILNSVYFFFTDGILPSWNFEGIFLLLMCLYIWFSEVPEKRTAQAHLYFACGLHNFDHNEVKAVLAQGLEHVLHDGYICLYI